MKRLKRLLGGKPVERNLALSRLHAFAEVWAIAGAAVIGAGASVYAANQQAGAARAGANAATNENSRQFDLVRSDTAAQRQLGTGATNLLSRLYGLPTYDRAQAAAQADVLVGDQYLPAGTTTTSVGNGWYDVMNGDTRLGTLRPGGSNGRFIGADGLDIPNFAAQLSAQRQAANPASTPAGATPDFNSFFETPDYQFNKQQSQQALDRSLLARGRGLSGAGVKEGERLASGLASQQFGDTFNRLSTLAGIGSAATNLSANAGLQTASNNSNILMNAANQRGSAYANGAAGVSDAVTGGISNYMFLQQLNKGAAGGYGTPPYAGSTTGYYNGGGIRLG